MALFITTLDDATIHKHISETFKFDVKLVAKTEFNARDSKHMQLLVKDINAAVFTPIKEARLRYPASKVSLRTLIVQVPKHSGNAAELQSYLAAALDHDAVMVIEPIAKI